MSPHNRASRQHCRSEGASPPFQLRRPVVSTFHDSDISSSAAAGAANPELEGADPSQPRLPRGRPDSIPLSSYDEDLPSDAEVVPLQRSVEEVNSAPDRSRCCAPAADTGC